MMKVCFHLQHHYIRVITRCGLFDTVCGRVRLLLFYIYVFVVVNKYYWESVGVLHLVRWLKEVVKDT